MSPFACISETLYATVLHMTDVLTHLPPRSVWHGWGDPREAHPLPDHAWRELERETGARRRPTPSAPPAIEDVRLPESRLTAADLAALRDLLGPEHVSDERAARVEHAGGKSYPDLRRLFDGDGGQAPDAVAYPADADEVAALLELAEERGLTVVPFGGGTSVVGGVTGERAGERPVVTLDLRRLDRMLHLDSTSRTATFQPGIRGPQVEAALHPHGLTLGHYPQSHQQATLGGYVATRSAGQASTGYGRIEDLVLGARLATPRGELVVGGRAPASAAGPRLLDLVVGSEGTLGVITEATVRLAALPTAKRYAAVAFPSFAQATHALRTLAQDVGHGGIPDVCRLSDGEETRVSLAMAGRSGRALARWLRLRRLPEPCLAILVWEGRDDDDLRERQRRCERVLTAHGARRLPTRIAQAWERGRFSGPYLRDELMRHGVLADTLETATTWTGLERLHDAVSAAIRDTFADLGTPAVVQCHISHVYAAGASLYYTFVARETDDPLAQWHAVKAAASRAIVDAGGTITHHHAVGSDHRPYLTDEIGPLGAQVLRAVKATLDPGGILNPGTLVPPSGQEG